MAKVAPIEVQVHAPKEKPVRVHPQVTAGGFVAILVAAVVTNLAWGGITVPLDVVAADTALLGFVVYKLWPSLNN